MGWKMAKGETCTIQGCSIITRYGEICDNHRWRFTKYGSYDLPDRTIVKICKVSDCDRPVDKSRSSLMCVMHRVRWSRHKSHDLPVKPGLPDGIEKICIHHGPLAREEVYLNGKNAQYQCRHCKKDSRIKFKEKNPNRDTNILKKYLYVGKGKLKVLKEDYEKLFYLQNGVCAICFEPQTMKQANGKGIKRLVLDHCHNTNKIRGLLCHHCNVSLGSFQDSIEILQSAIKYLKKHAPT